MGGGRWVGVGVVGAGSAGRQRRGQVRAEVQVKLIDRFGTADEVVRVVQSDEGRRFLGDPPAVARKGYIGGIRWGIIMALAGFCFVMVGRSSKQTFPFNLGVMLIGFGVGLVLRRFGVPERGGFTAVGLFVLIWWCVPFSVHDKLWGKLK